MALYIIDDGWDTMYTHDKNDEYVVATKRLIDEGHYADNSVIKVTKKGRVMFWSSHGEWEDADNLDAEYI